MILIQHNMWRKTVDKTMFVYQKVLIRIFHTIFLLLNNLWKLTTREHKSWLCSKNMIKTFVIKISDLDLYFYTRNLWNIQNRFSSTKSPFEFVLSCSWIHKSCLTTLSLITSIQNELLTWSNDLEHIII